MRGVLKGVVIGLAAYLLARGGGLERIRHDAMARVRQVVRGGTLRAGVDAGFFEPVNGHVSRLTLTGTDVRLEEPGLFLVPRGPGGLRIGKLRIRLRQVDIAALHAARFRADIPSVELDAAQALLRDRLVLRSARTGSAFARVDTDGLRRFAVAKYGRFIHDVHIWTQNDRLYVTALAQAFGGEARLLVSGTLSARDGRFVDLADVRARLGATFLASGPAQALVAQLNPLLDLQADLGVADFITVSDVQVEDGYVTVHGTARCPTARGEIR